MTRVISRILWRTVVLLDPSAVIHAFQVDIETP